MEEEKINLRRMWGDTAGAGWGRYEYDEDTLCSYMKFKKTTIKMISKKNTLRNQVK